MVSTIVNEISQAVESSTTGNGNICLYLVAPFTIIIVALLIIIIVMAMCKYIQILNVVSIIIIIIIIYIDIFFLKKSKNM